MTCTFLRSSLIGNNDLGWRGFLFAQFVLLLWATDLLARRTHVPRRGLLTALIVLGVAGALYDVVILRIYPLLSDRGSVRFLSWMTADRQLGRRTYDVREAYEWAQARIPPEYRVQHNPDVAYQDTPAGLYADRPSAAFDMDCMCAFGGNPRECAPVAGSLKQLFSAGATPENFDEVCRAVQVDILMAKDTDPAWNTRQSWIWTHEAIFANPHVRLFRCRSHSADGGNPQGGSAAHP